MNSNKAEAAENFHKAVLALKVSLILILGIMAAVNRQTYYIKQHTMKFLMDVFLTGLTAAVATGFLMFTRGGGHYSYALAAFMIFAFYAVVREVAGYFTVLGTESANTKTKKEVMFFKKHKSLLVVMGLILLTIVGVTMFDAYKIQMPPMFRNGSSSQVLLFFEALTFAAILAAAESKVAANHKDPPKSAFFQALLMFVAAHYTMQNGGVYRSLEAAASNIKLN